MDRLLTRTYALFFALAAYLGSPACGAELPTVEQVLDVCRANRERMHPLHVRLEHIEEQTEAFGKSQTNQAAGIEAVVKQLEAGESVPGLEDSIRAVGREALIQQLKQSVDNHRHFTQPERFRSTYEFFVAGEDYQVRSLPLLVGNEKPTLALPETPLGSTSLTGDYAHVRIYSRSASRTPAAQIWPGRSSPNRQVFAMSTSKHLSDTQSVQFPPFSVAMQPRWDQRHPIDTFLSAPNDSYHIAGMEEKDGRQLTIVDVAVPTELTSGFIDENGQPQQTRVCYWYRAWLDMERGGIPLEMHFWHGSEGKPFDERFRIQPARVMKATEVKKLENGGWYPAQTEEDVYGVDPSAPALSEAEWKEVRAGTREAPPSVVHQRHTWNCTVIDTIVPGGDEFFVLNFPAGQTFFDIDTEKVVGALERKPYVKPGELAPAWQIARWLDGEQHSLDDFRGKVVVLDFWGLWCGACRSGTPALVALQEKYKDQPVVFVSIHTAEGDAEDLAARIEKYAKESHWQFLASIDSGTMSEDSATSCAYGCESFPSQLVIGVDGRVKYNSSSAPKGLEDLMGKPCDEVTPEDEARMNAHMAEVFRAAGERWPLPANATNEQNTEVMNRVSVFLMSQEIDSALHELK